MTKKFGTYALLLALTVAIVVPLWAAGKDTGRDTQQQAGQQGRQQDNWRSNQSQQDTWTDQQGRQGWSSGQRNVDFSAQQLHRAERVIGRDIDDSQGNKIGEVHDIVLTADRQSIAYLAVSRGGFLGIGQKLYAVPVQAFTFRGEDQPLLTNISESQLDQSPGFNRDNWPDNADLTFAAAGKGMSQQGASGRQQDWRSGTDVNAGRSDMDDTEYGMDLSDRDNDYARADKDRIEYRRVSNLIGLDVKNFQDDSLGTIESVVFTASPRGQMAMRSAQVAGQPDRSSDQMSQNRMQQGMGQGYSNQGMFNQPQVLYALIGHGGLFGISEDLTPVPWSAVEITPTLDVARVNATTDTLAGLTLPNGDVNRLTDQQFAQRVFSSFNEQPYWEVYGYAPAGQGARGYSAWSQEGYDFTGKKTEKIEGTVDSIGAYSPQAGVTEGLRLRIKSDDNKFYTVHAGPRQYAQQQSFNLKYGDRITVTGYRMDIAGQTVLVASKIEKDGQTLELRDDQGKPKWSGTMDQGTQQQGTQQQRDQQQGTQQPEQQGGQRSTGQQQPQRDQNSSGRWSEYDRQMGR